MNKDYQNYNEFDISTISIPHNYFVLLLAILEIIITLYKGRKMMRLQNDTFVLSNVFPT